METKKVQEYLKKIETVIEKGKFKDNWQSLAQFKMPDWYRKRRFGLFIHWGCYSVPATESEWYPRQMYIKGTKSWNHRVANYGENGDYRQVVAQFDPKKFDAKEWLSLFSESGAKSIMPVCEHHDGIKMYESILNEWNTKKLLNRDFMTELKAEAEKNDILFFASNHRAEHYWFLNGARKNCPNSEVTKNLYPELYGPAVLPENGEPSADRTLKVSEEWLEDWLTSACEMIDRLQPYAVYFDWWIYMPEFKPYLKKFLAYYYNRGVEWNKEVGVFYKSGSVMKGCAIYDVERGQIDGIAAELWQNDTAIAKNSWGYTEGNNFKTTNEVIKNMIDVVSKNGCYMLNVGPKADGTICEEEKAVLKGIGKWLKVNGEAIYDSYPYEVFGEGKKVKSGAFKENLKYNKKDFRFTYKTNAIYVFPMCDKIRNTYIIKSLKSANEHGIRYNIKNIEILGLKNKVSFTQNDLNLTINVDGVIETTMPICIKVAVD